MMYRSMGNGNDMTTGRGLAAFARRDLPRGALEAKHDESATAMARRRMFEDVAADRQDVANVRPRPLAGAVDLAEPAQSAGFRSGRSASRAGSRDASAAGCTCVRRT